MKNNSKSINAVINTLALVIALVGVLMLATQLPIPGGYKLYAVRSSSMEPAIKRGSLIIALPQSNYVIDDIVTRKIEGNKTTITHRIISEVELDNQAAFYTKGDNNKTDDHELVRSQDIIGKVVLIIPFLGFFILLTQAKYGLILLVILPWSMIFILESIKAKKQLDHIIAHKRKEVAHA